MAFVGKKFPNLSVNVIDKTGVTQSINILEKAQKEQKKVILFWYPKDFTFVCPTELHAFQNAVAEFEKRNTLVIGASCDTAEVHFAWLNTSKNHGGIEGVTYPLVADTNRNLASTLGILDATNERFDDELETVVMDGDNVTYRATYLIDEEGMVFHESINHMPVGRNVSEFIRLIDAYSHVQKFGEVCPANWQEGATAMNADRDGVSEYLSQHVN
ncbi:MAG: alkyl hydroperoxide reductase [Alteromonas sp.]|nr:alkyl hydroperoxide reductase [Alteromonas sp.]MAY22050.1 alkyl hydroperoxide reductase [Flavobacteriaceae bacterium]|tara:strand:+ start:11700 stop:12344 length:645 start_codon:yes stop_codon:yes gene_type:complete